MATTTTSILPVGTRVRATYDRVNPDTGHEWQGTIIECIPATDRWPAAYGIAWEFGKTYYERLESIEPARPCTLCHELPDLAYNVCTVRKQLPAPYGPVYCPQCKQVNRATGLLIGLERAYVRCCRALCPEYTLDRATSHIPGQGYFCPKHTPEPTAPTSAPVPPMAGGSLDIDTAAGLYICAGNHPGCLFSATAPTCPVAGCTGTVEYCGRDTAANRAAMQQPGPLAWIGEEPPCPPVETPSSPSYVASSLRETPGGNESSLAQVPATMNATTAPATPSDAPSPTTLIAPGASLPNCSLSETAELAAVFSAILQDPEVCPVRLEAAARLLDGVERDPTRAGAWLVRSASAPERAYHVVAGLCDCPDAGNRDARRCKHALAVRAFALLERRDAEASDPAAPCGHPATRHFCLCTCPMCNASAAEAARIAEERHAARQAEAELAAAGSPPMGGGSGEARNYMLALFGEESQAAPRGWYTNGMHAALYQVLLAFEARILELERALAARD